MQDFVTWELLATFAGSTAAVAFLTQVIKKFVGFDPKFIALALATLIMAAVQFLYLKDFSAGGIALAAINILVVTGAAIGLYEAAIKGLSGDRQ